MLQHAFNTRLLRAHVDFTSARLCTLGKYLCTLFTETQQKSAFACTARAQRQQVASTCARHERALKCICSDSVGVR